MKYQFHAVVIGVSAGGFHALNTILPMFPENFPVPIIIVQHRIESGDDYFVESLNKKSKLTVKESEDKESIVPGKVYIAPGGYHLYIEKDHTFSLSVDEPVCYARPSIDVLFETAADVFCSNLVGIILTGANSDGTNGIKAIKAKQGFVIAQDPDKAESKFMPISAIKTNLVDFILALEDIPGFLIALLENANECE